MKIAKIINNSSAEVEGHFSDIVYLQGCDRCCPWCFNKDLWPYGTEYGKEMSLTEILYQLSNMSDVVVFTGGEPVLQRYELGKLIFEIKMFSQRKVVLETSYFDTHWYNVDKVLYSIDTRNIDDYGINQIKYFPNVIPVVVIGHSWFDREGFRKILQLIEGDVWVKYYNGKPCNMRDIIHLLKFYKKKLKVLDKICL